MRLDVDCLVVGAGAAGCTCGTLLHRAGKDVLALELHDAREKDKLCGGAIGGSAPSELRKVFGPNALEELGVHRPALVLRRCLEKEVVEQPFFDLVERKRLDSWLLERYLEEGGKLRDRCRLTAVDARAHVARCTDLRTGEELEIGYGVLIGADGAASAVRRLVAGSHQQVVPAIEGTVDAAAGDCIIFERRPASEGYCWYFPIGGRANVGCMSYNEDVPTCRAWLAEFCRRVGVEMPELRGAPIPSGSDVLLKAGEDAWLIGDAAGLASPLDGGGIHYALESARLLAESLLGGASYEEAVQPIISGLELMEQKRTSQYLLSCLAIAKQGRTY